MRVACDFKGCGYVAEHPTKYVNCMIANHKSRTHGIKGKSAKYRLPKPETSGTSEVEKPPRKPRPPSVGLNFCPCCGTSLRAVKIAIEL